MLLVATVGQRQTVAARCERAAAAGVAPGMTLAHARALLPADGLQVVPFTPERDAARLHALAVWALRFCPIVAADPPDGLLLDTTGCERVWGGERRLVATLAHEVRRLGFAARVAAAGTFGCAWALARFAPHPCLVVPPGGERAALAALPVRALGIGDEAAVALAEVGVERVEHLLALPRRDLPARFGPELLLRLDRALGSALEIIEPVREVHPPCTDRVFDGPTTQVEAIELTVRELVAALCMELERRGSGAKRIDLTLHRIDAAAVRARLVLSRPSRTPAHLWTLLRPRVERANLGYGVERVVVAAPVIGRLRHEQAEHWRSEREDARAEQAAGELIDTLVGRLGPNRVLRFEAVESHLPERSFRARSVLEAPRSADAQPVRVTASDRPSVLLDTPEPIDVMAMVPDGPPVWVRWRGERVEVRAAVGPERLAPEWWTVPGGSGPNPRPQPQPFATRDCFRLQDERGRWLWVYREAETAHWFIHGLWA